jgi:dTDP-4-dehydrorhamnose reductase
MKLAVIGAAGLLGRKLTAAAAAAGHEVYPFDVAAGLETPAGPVQLLDLLDPSAVGRTIRALAPEWVLNTAAFTAVDTSEAQRDLAWKVNVDAVGYLLGACRTSRSRLLAISTDYVFDGRSGPYAEDAPRRPLGFYGRTKAAMEDLIAAEEDHHLVVRTMVLYGAETGVRPNFALWLLDSLRRGTPIRVVTDQMGNPTLAADLARMLLVMVAAGGKGLYHAAGADRVSRYDFAVELARVFGLDPAPIEPVTTADLDQAADRPLESGFVLDRIRRDFGLLPLGLHDSLKAFREEVDRAGM